jgi:hypothetical protein
MDCDLLDTPRTAMPDPYMTKLLIYLFFQYKFIIYVL